ncbi:MAG TPA: DUF4062 domain-containing protein [Anaerolineae bacterium]|nr:DUF4062 domain-containing protein [Anaerolineae bacterium]HQK15062.1 DUF4062 domain-containing protein [Anaerolineae bacterium]
MNTEERIKQIRELLDIYERQRHRLNLQIASHGGETSAPIGMLDQRDEISTNIQKLEMELQQAVNSLRRQPLTLPVSTVNKVTLPPIRVFVSSTMKDLQPERDAVARALQSLDLEVVRAESIGSQSSSPYEVSLMMAQQCDIYLGIYGGRYGSIVPGDGRSITEIEYHAAREQGKPILLYRKTGVDVEPAQAEFLTFVGDMKQGHTWREFNAGDVPGQLMAWVQADVRAEVRRHPEWATRPPTRERVLLASLGRSPGAVTGLYHALARAGKAITRVVTFSPAHRDVRDAAGICADEFRKIGIPYHNHFIDAEDIKSEADAREFKSMFAGLLQEHLTREAEVLVGITGGRTVMGALMAIVVQTTAPENVALYHLDVDDAIEAEGRLPELWRFEGTERWQELLAPPADLCHLVQVPYVKFPTHEN